MDATGTGASNTLDPAVIVSGRNSAYSTRKMLFPRWSLPGGLPQRALAVSDLPPELRPARTTSWREQWGTRLGKGGKDRVVPIGERALAWHVRPQFVVEPDGGACFLGATGEGLSVDWLTAMVRNYVRKAGVQKPGSCHLFRHTAATMMLEGGADVRFIQALLGHAKLDSTAIYTRVSVRMLKDVHSATHPGAMLKRSKKANAESAEAEVDPQAVKDALDEEADEERE